MKLIKHDVTKIIIATAIFPIILAIVGLFAQTKTSSSIWQGVGDLAVFVVAYLLNRQYFGQKVSWFNKNNFTKQLSTALPAIIIVAFLNSPMLAVSDFKIKFQVIIICLLVGLAEEYIFRGLLFSLFLKLLHDNVFGAVIGSSVMFGLLHLINLRALSFGYVSIQVIFAAAIGILFGTIYVKTKNLSIVILLHALRDMFPMFSNKMMAMAAKTSFSKASLYAILVFLAITLIIAYVQLQNFEIQKSEI